LEVVEHLREVAVRLDLARVEGDRLLVRHRQDELAVVAVAELEDLGDVVAPRGLPELGGREDGHQHLLRADRVQLLADDPDHLLVDAPAERQERPHAGADLTDEGAAHQQLVTDRLRVRRRLAQGRQEEL
jgi:hypothetical protein